MDYDDLEDNHIFWQSEEDEYLNPYTNSFASYSLGDLWDDCLLPTLSDGASASKILLITCLILRLTLYFGKIPINVAHLGFAASGVLCLYHFFNDQLVYVLIFISLAILSTSLQNFAGRHYKSANVALCIFFLLSCELFIVNKAHWHKIRGSQMVLAMKIVSLALDMDKITSKPSVLEQFSYYLNPAALIFGPWIKYNDHLSMFQNAKLFPDFLGLLRCIFLAGLFLTISTCWTSWFISDALKYNIYIDIDFFHDGYFALNELLCHKFSQWLLAYRDALSFRSSHYFISYLSELTLIFLGHQSLSVSSPLKIELPRSLVDVVVYWNWPMHQWLKHYVFRIARPYGTFLAIFSTYCASALLHGLNFQLAAVLLSLGFYTYIEFVLRQKLSYIFNACIEARACNVDCQHKYKQGYVRIVNCLFGFLAVFHLAYLGVMFDSSSTIQEEGYSMSHTLNKWSELSFVSHWVALASYIFYLLV